VGLAKNRIFGYVTIFGNFWLRNKESSAMTALIPPVIPDKRAQIRNLDNSCGAVRGFVKCSAHSIEIPDQVGDDGKTCVIPD
jgi:hypothetical protein